MNFLKILNFVKLIESIKKCSLTLEVVLEHLQVGTDSIREIWQKNAEKTEQKKID